MRCTGDPIADSVVEQLFQTNGIAATNALWTHLLVNDEVLPSNAPPFLVDFVNETSRLPHWADPTLIRQANAFFERHGPICLVALLWAGLPECYVLHEEAQVLATTRELQDHAYRRIFETVQLVVAVMQDGSFTATGSGIKAAQKVRLMHASIRHLILNVQRKRPDTTPPSTLADAISVNPPWDDTRRGPPIDQELLAYTLLTFSLVTLQVFDTLKIKVTAQERDAFIHAWNIVGHLIGLHERLLPRSMEDAHRLFEIIRSRRMRPSDEAQHLMRALNACSKQIITHETAGWFPRLLIKPISAVLFRILIQKNSRKILTIPQLSICEMIWKALLRMWLWTLARFYNGLVVSLGRCFAQIIVAHLTKIPRSRRALFQLPDHLAVKWRFANQPKRTISK